MRLAHTLPRALPRTAGAQPSLSFRRHASTSQSLPRRFLGTSLLLGGTFAAVAYYYDSRSLVHEHVVMPIVRLVDPESGHKIAIRALGLPWWARPKDLGVDGKELETAIFGLKVNNPVGMAAGFDKDGEAIDGLFDLGFGYVEIGSVTPEPQPGNPQPRFFRLEEDQACINRYGFNSLGHGQTLGRLRARIHSLAQSQPSLFSSPLPPNPLPPASLPRSLRPGHVLAVNLGKNKTSAAESNEDYIKGVRTLGPYADVVVINVSSPNTPGLRALQGREILQKLLQEVVEERDRIKSPEGLPRLAVKVACDLNEEELGDVAAAVRNSGVDGVIVSNTTIRRKGLGLLSDEQNQMGGLSGKPLFPYALDALRTLRPLLPPSTPIVGCGGISSGSDAVKMAQAGASLIQVYTLFGYRGVGTPRLLKDEITQALLGHTWKNQIGTEWEGQQMGWDEKRLEKESQALKKEAEGLGELLRHLNEKEDMQKLVREAEEALKRESKATQPRDNLMGSQAPANEGEGEKMEKKAQGALEKVEHGAERVGNALEQAIVAAIEAATPRSNRSGEAQETPAPAPVETRPSPGKEQDDFRRSVRTGQRRLV